ncbi:MAG: D-alanyl-D-alanine carboxypeptidase family protein [Christensenellales bacterium]|uniref:serine-type D-Ala-D-Ala carboxypeptidase n=1 Tax=Candidatus Avichristensenella intestinipullorum TaxID=2840693 RepID=A0A9D1CI62_9FIRM|nr:D-alanyl-D-alanine carboxypeptidase family protein [Christensenellales bacterium]HIQ62028.1 D-alanyl-D-alanine carboxypeptidase [Candidatus Avichristensenella intestinipullorum]
MKQLLAPVLALCLAACPALAAPLEPVSSFDLQTPSYLLMEASTGQVILEQNADETRPVASVTKLMTLLLVLEALDAGTVSLTDSIVCSSNAAGMGGSQALLDAGSAYPLEDLLKSTIVASANDSAVALAEHLAGTEANFVERMNRRAAELGLTQTVYQNCTGLPAEGQHTTARDVANLSRQIGRHPLYYQYSTLWMDTLEHPGGRTTDLVNTNRLVRFFEGCDGYKTGSTDEARYCISATAQKDGMRLIAVLLGTPASQTRFNEARKLLEYGFSTYRLLPVCQAGDALGEEVSVARGSADTVGAAAGAGMTLLIRRGEESSVSLQVALPEEVQAPVAKGDTLGELRVLKDGNLIATLPATASEDVGLPGYLEALLRILQAWRR